MKTGLTVLAHAVRRVRRTKSTMRNSTDYEPREENIRTAWNVLSENREVRYFAKRNDGSALGGRVYSPKDLLRAAENLENLGYDVYVHLNPSVGLGLKATSRQVTAFRRLLIDLDPVSPELDATTAISSVLELAESIHQGIAMAAHVLDTGRGAQAWVETDSSSLEGAERATAEFLRQLRRAWDGRAGYRIDSVCYDLGRVARCPGTKNTKTGRMAVFVKTAQVPLNAEHFLTAFHTEPPKQALERPENISNLMAVSAHLNGLAREFLHSGVEEGDRHHAAYVAARSLLELGMGTDAVTYWVCRGAVRCRPRLPKRDALHCVETAMRKA